MLKVRHKKLTASHFDFAPINQRTSALGQWATAFCSSSSSWSLYNTTTASTSHWLTVGLSSTQRSQWTNEGST